MLRELVLEPTAWCPQRCRHCSSESHPGCTASLAPAKQLGLIDEAADLGASQISFGGGEPTSAKGFVEAVEHAIDLGLSAEVFTCGITATGPQLIGYPESFLARLSSLPKLKFIFSLHGPDAATHDGMTMLPGSFQCMLASLRACQDAGIACEANFVPVKPNYRLFSDVLSVIEVLDLGKVSVLRFVPQGRGERNSSALVLTEEQERDFVSELLSLRQTRSIDIRTGSPFNGVIQGNAVPCRAGSSKLVVQADGNVLPCEVYKHSERSDWGLSVHTASLGEILHDPSLEALRKTLDGQGCHLCPIHSVLRKDSQRGGQEHRSDETAVHA